jgi:hypothetical protein
MGVRERGIDNQGERGIDTLNQGGDAHKRLGSGLDNITPIGTASVGEAVRERSFNGGDLPCPSGDARLVRSEQGQIPERKLRGIEMLDVSRILLLRRPGDLRIGAHGVEFWGCKVLKHLGDMLVCVS